MRLKKILTLIMLGVFLFSASAYCTVANTNNRTTLAANGALTDFDFTFKVFNTTDFDVYLVAKLDDSDSTLQTITTDYTVALATSTEGGTITMNSAPSSDYNVVMIRNIDYTQPTDIPKHEGFSERKIENALDRQVMQTQQVVDDLTKTVKVTTTSSLTDLELPAPEAGSGIIWNDTEDGLTNTTADLSDLDATIAAAEAAQAGAEAAEAGALVAETGAETAQAGAETAEAGAEAAQAAAELAAATFVVDDVTLETTTDTHIKALGVGTSEIANLAIVTGKIADNNVTSAKLEDDLVFGSFPLTPSSAPDADYEVANKKYVDDNASKSEYFTTSGTFTAPTGVTTVLVTMAGGGGGGAGGDQSVSGGGGGAGASSVIRKAIAVTPASDYTVTIGSAGTAGSVGGGAGGNGGDSSITSDDDTITAEGGDGGTSGTGATAVVVSLDGIDGASGGAGGLGNYVGGDGGDSGNNNNGGGGGGSMFGKGGDGSGSAGEAGQGFGAGGAGGYGGNSSQYAGAAGTGGFVLVEWF